MNFVSMLVLVCASVLVASTPSTTWTKRHGVGMQWMRIARGGSGFESYTAIAVIPGYVTDVEALSPLLQTAFQDKDACSLILVERDHGVKMASSLPKNEYMMETLSMACDILVLSLEEVSLETVTRILEGAKRRHSAGSSKLKLVVVVPTDMTADEKEYLVQQDLKAVTPQYFDAFEIVSLEEIESVWNDLVADSQESAPVIEQDGLAPLVQAIYKTLSGKSCSIQLEQCTTEKSSQSVRVKTHTTPTESKSLAAGEISRQIMSAAQPQLDLLEAKQEEVWLTSDSVPMLEFGSDANAILQQASDALGAFVPPIDAATRTTILLLLCSKVRRLFDQQLQSLREHYGKRYEAVLDSVADQNEWTQEAARATQAFRTAAQHAVPRLCQEGQELRDADFSYVNVLQGLISDMMEATTMREELNAAVAPDDEEEGEQPRVVKWYEKLAARVAVLGVNYLQGWMAWQAIQRAAADRDRNMPKFPLF